MEEHGQEEHSHKLIVTQVLLQPAAHKPASTYSLTHFWRKSENLDNMNVACYLSEEDLFYLLFGLDTSDGHGPKWVISLLSHREYGPWQKSL